MKRKTFKAVAYEYSHDTFDNVYCLGKGVGFSDSVAKAIKEAKYGALQSLNAAEAEENSDGTPILATVQVYKNGEEIINDTY